MNKFSNLTVIFLFFVVLASCNPNPNHSKINNQEVASESNNNNEAVPSVKLVKPVIKVYIENSGSMDGYVNGHTDFKYSLYKLLTEISRNDNDVKVNVVFKSGIRSLGKDANIINKLEPGTDNSKFRLRSDKVTGTQLEDIIKNVVTGTGLNTVSILISDFIYSDKSSTTGIAGVAVQKIFQDKLKTNLDFGLIMLKLDSQFDGTYFPEIPGAKSYPILQRRPYYIWIMGSSFQITGIKKLIDGAGLKGCNPYDFYMFSNTVQNPDLQVLMSPRIGVYIPDKKAPKTSIINARIETKGINSTKFQFSVGIDFSKFSMPDNYITDKDNYKPIPDYFIEIIQYPAAAGSKYTHILKLTTTKLKKEIIQIELLNKIPKWIEESNSINDANVQNKDQLDKTFGYRDLVKGIYDAFALKSLFKTSISINK